MVFLVWAGTANKVEYIFLKLNIHIDYILEASNTEIIGKGEWLYNCYNM